MSQNFTKNNGNGIIMFSDPRQKRKGFDIPLQILQQDPNFQDVIAYNTLIEKPVIVKDLPFCKCRNPKNGDEWNDEINRAFLKYCLEKHKVVITENSAKIAVEMVADENKFCPFQNYLNSLKWDGVYRIEQLFIKYFGVEDNALHREASKLLLVAIVARAFIPACKYDHMIVLQGGQGAGKSTFLQHLVGIDFFTDELKNFSGNEAVESLLGKVLVEVAELQGFKKADINSLKAFITRTVDRCRLAFKKFVKEYPRRCVLVGTTNDDSFLNDPTGNRRFICINDCQKIYSYHELIEEIAKNRDQWFAEAVETFRTYQKQYGDNIPLTLQSKQAEELAEEAQKKVENLDPLIDVIAEYLDKPIPPDFWEQAPFTQSKKKYTEEQLVKRDKISTREICQEILGLSYKDMPRTLSTRISAIMKKLGWTKCVARFGTRYGVANGYKRKQ